MSVLESRNHKSSGGVAARPDPFIPIEAAVSIAVGVGVGIFVAGSTDPATGLVCGIGVTGVMHRLLKRK